MRISSRRDALYQKILLAIIIFLFSNSVFSYQFDAYVVGGKQTYKGNDERTDIGTSLQVLFNPIETQPGPYAEQAFIARASSIHVIAMTHDFDLHQSGSSNINSGGLAVTLAAKESSWASQFGYLELQGETDLDIGLTYDSDLQNFWLGAGYYVKPTVMVHATVDYTEWRALELQGEELRLEVGIKALLDDINIEMDLRHVHYDENGEEDDNIETRLVMNYYFNPSTSIGGHLAVNRGDAAAEEFDEVGMSLFKFFRRYYVELAYAKDKDKLDDDQSSDLYAVTLGARW